MLTKFLLKSWKSSFLHSSSFHHTSLNKICNTIEEALAGLKSGDKILVGGSGVCGIPENFLRYIVSQPQYKDFWAVSGTAGQKFYI